MINLRPYQTDAITQMRALFAKQVTRLILCIATGGGKTYTFACLSKMVLEKKSAARVGIFTHRTELLTQAGGALTSFGIAWSAIDPKSKQNHHARCYVGKVKTFINRAKKHPHLLDLDVVIIDEAHRGEFKALLPILRPTTWVIGVTATPISSSKKDPLNRYYQEIVVPVTISDLIEEGFLMPAETYAAKTDTSALKMEMGEYTEKSQMDVFAKREVYDGVINKYIKLASGKKAVCYNVNIEHSIEVCRRFLEAGIEAEHVDGNTPDDQRDAIFKRLRSGQTKVLCNVDVATAGLDVPSIEVCIVNCATSSLTKWLQMCGRSARPCPEIGKEKHIIIDMGNNWKHLGLWEDERDWVEMFHNPVKAKKKGANDAPAPVKDCPDCDALLKISERICPHCGHEFPPELRKPNIVEEVEFDLISSVKPRDWGKLSVEDLVKLQTIKEYKPGWILHQLRERAGKDPVVYERLIRELAAYKNYKKGWIPRELENYSTILMA